MAGTRRYSAQMPQPLVSWPGIAPMPVRIAATAGAVWYGTRNPPAVHRMDLATGVLTATIGSGWVLEASAATITLPLEFEIFDAHGTRLATIPRQGGKFVTRLGPTDNA